jgi:transcriptional regulator with XRE-family HTH domain
MNLGPTLRRWRRRRGLTQVDVAQRARISQGFLSELETGTKTVVTLPVAVRLAKVLGVGLDTLVK